ncbi:MAG: lipid exporter, fused ATPase and inner rane subunit MsbA [Verrucomicrobiales bacterium]|nr:lipid exporter, fused ATPase and inner rane subunit MsbA [Verrucomicrobiales bacterium]
MTRFLFKVLAYTRPYSSRLALGILAGLLCGVLEPALMITVKLAVGAVFPTPGAASLLEKYPRVARNLQWVGEYLPKSGEAASARTTILLIALIPTVMFLRGFVAYVNVYLLQWVASRTMTDIRTKLFQHILSLDLGFFGRMSTGELLSRITADIIALQTTLTGSLSIVVRDPAVLIGLATLLLWQQPKLTAVSLLVFPICLVPVIIYGKKVRHSSAAIQSQFAALNQIMHESFTGNRVIKAYNLENKVIEQFKKASARAISHYMRVIRSMELPGPLIEFFGAVGVALIFCFILLGAQTRMNAEDFLQFIGCIFLMYRPFKNLSRLHNQIEQARAASQRVFEMLEVRTAVVEPAQAVPLQAKGADIHFEHITFGYGDKQVLREFDLTVKAGTLVALVGSTGSGKTTITNLLLRFYDPEKGRVRIGNTDLRSVSTKDLRNQIAVVTQDTILFNDTIQNNILLGREGATPDEVVMAAKHAHAHEFITAKKDGYNSNIGEKGGLLSGGQKQRLAIARAILKDAPILILDEATSALDTETERAVQGAFEELMQGRTTMCIAHRLSTIQKADVIIVLHEGRIVEQGSHSELLQREGLYKRLYELQFQQ